MTARISLVRRTPMPAVIALAGMLLVLSFWAFWSTLGEVAQKWAADPQYSHGYLVPVYSLVLLWLRWKLAAGIRWGVHARGLLYLAAGLFLRCANLLSLNSVWIDGLAFVLSIAGIVVVMGGSEAWQWAWPAVGFLVFMLPLPYSVERKLGGELQTIATGASTFLLQLIGLPAIAEGNVILLADLHLGVAEACSGLSMLLIFIALGVAFAAVVKRPMLDRVLLVASTIPIALAANILRITTTGALHVWVGTRIADLVFHDLAGWLMMPLALGLLWLELRFLSLVLVDDVRPDRVESAVGTGSPALTLER